jgi:competence protein ComEC
MKLYCLDVGQGTCNVLVLRGGRAVVVDCGPRGEEVLTLLKRCRVQYIERLIVSHNDSDHSGGAAAVLTAYRKAIGKVWFVKDSRFFGTPFWGKIEEEINQHHLRKDQLVRLELDEDNQPRQIYADRSEQLLLKVLAPTYYDNLDSLSKKAPNSTSGIVVLEKGERCVVFAGGAGYAEWQGVYEARKATLHCDVLAVPHHGGKVGKEKEVARLYGDAVSPRYAVISVGTENRYSHPREDVVCALVEAGASVLCTQITRRCCGNLETFRREASGRFDLGRSESQWADGRSGDSQHVACAGTVVIRLVGNRVIVERSREHRRLINVLSTKTDLRGQPLCRRTTASPQSKNPTP